MTLPYLAILKTDRDIERGAMYSGSTQAGVENEARGWLQRHGAHGDSFSVYRVDLVAVATIACDKAAPPPPEPKAGRHAFRKGKGLYCDTCGGAEREHC